MRQRYVVLIGMTIFAACSGSTTGVGGGTNTSDMPTLTIVSGVGITDTIDAELPEPLTIELRSHDGAPVVGAEVTFSAVQKYFAGTGPLALRAFGVYFGDSGAYTTHFKVFATTDATGRASTFVQLGVIPGVGQISIEVPVLHLDTIVEYTIQPGAAVDMVFSPADTAIYAGARYDVHATTVDRWKNTRDDPVAFSAGTAGIDVTASGTVTGREISRSYLVAMGSRLRDSAWVSVVPEGRIAAVREFYTTSGRQRGLVLMNLDGSDYREFYVDPDESPHPDWAPSGESVIMERGNQLVTVDAAGVQHALPLDSTRLQAMHYPQYSPDGTWIYFAGVPVDAPDNSVIWRMHADGSAPESLSPIGYTQPSPSPDGQRVVYMTIGCCDNRFIVLDPATGQTDTLMAPDGTELTGLSPRWSPGDPTRIAFARVNLDHTPGIIETALTVYVARIDGTERRAITPPELSFHREMDWSPDGQWIIAQATDTRILQLIEVATGRILPLAFTASMSQPAWSPSSSATP